MICCDNCTRWHHQIIYDSAIFWSHRFARVTNDVLMDTRPLGQQPTRIIPAAISFGKLKTMAVRNSLILNSVPIQNMMICNNGRMRLDNFKLPAWRKNPVSSHPPKDKFPAKKAKQRLNKNNFHHSLPTQYIVFSLWNKWRLWRGFLIVLIKKKPW